ncbi:hypothetical protein OH407_24375, partial [Salmonella enterica]|uniref:hypothetical protein n=1 Tax=Salmonella enterica TaxID=28901 RepID=UPI0022B5ECE3
MQVALSGGVWRTLQWCQRRRQPTVGHGSMAAPRMIAQYGVEGAVALAVPGGVLATLFGGLPGGLVTA